MISDLIPDKLTQGTIFTCARSDIYSGPVHGFIITARCDVAHGKNDTYAYLPILSLEAWAKLDGALLTARRTASNCTSVLEDVLQKSALAKSILEKISHSEIAKYLQRQDGKDAKRRYEKFSANASALADCKMTLANREPSAREKILKNHASVFKGVYKDLHSNAISDFHYLPRLSDGEAPEGYVLSLREVRHLSRRTAKKIEEGFDSTMYASNDLAELESDRQLSFSAAAEFAMPLSQMRSPDTELIMQRFTQLFARIGVEDLKKDDIDVARDKLAQKLEIDL